MNVPLVLADVLALPHDDAYSRVMGFARRFGEPHATLAMHTAFPLGLSPELVHLLRINLAPQAPFIAEADLLLSSLCREVGGGLYEMDTSVRELLLDELIRDAQLGLPQLSRIADFVAAYAERALGRSRDPDMKNFLRVQQWTALAYLQPERAARQITQEIEDAKQAQDAPRIIRLARITDALSAPLAGQRRLTSAVARLKYPLARAGTGDAIDQDRASTHQYVSAKVVVLGDAGVGKSGLAMVLAGEPYQPTDSTHGRFVWTLNVEEVQLPGGGTQTREVLLWDLAGQPGYRLIHQLHLEGAAVALIVFDSRAETDPFSGVTYWARALTQARRLEGAADVPLTAYLVAARADRGGTGISAEHAAAIVAELDLDGYYEISAKEGWHIADLTQAIRDGVDWDALPVMSSSTQFHSIRQFLLHEKRQGRLLGTVDDLFHGFRRAHPDEADDGGLRASFETCIGREESRGLILRLHFGDLVLLQPELLDAYASGMVQAAREEQDGLGFIAEEDALAGRFRLAESERVRDKAQEKLLLIATVEELLRHEIALKESTERGVDLVFPSQFTRARVDAPDIPGAEVIFAFEGPPPSIYATLAVRLSHSRLFRRQEMWQNAASYTATAGGLCGIHLRELEEGRGELVLSYDRQASRAVRSQFETYVAEHLQLRAVPGTLSRRVIRACPNCGYVLPEELIRRRIERGATTARCPACEESLIPLVEEPTTPAEGAMAEMYRSANERRNLNAAALRLRGKMETGDYDVFLCHNSRDKRQVMAIGEQLKLRGILPWLDVWEIRPGMFWQKELRKQLKSIKSAVVFIGPEGPGPWQELEAEALLGEIARRNRPIIPVILEGREGNPRLPAFLDMWHAVDMRQPDPDPFEQLVWGITGERPAQP